MSIDDDYMKKLRERSGDIESEDPLVTFLYILMRDHVTPGVIEGIMFEHVQYDEGGNKFTNGWLANYCKDIAERLRKDGSG